MENIFIRRSIRKYTNDKVEIEKIEKMIKAGMQAPSAGNQQPWEFIVIREEKMLKKLSNVSEYANFLADAPLAIVMLINDDNLKFVECVEQDMGACAQNILLEAVHLGLGGVWLGVKPEEERMNFISDIFDLPNNIKPFSILSIGYPKDESANKFIDRYDSSRVNYEAYNK